jgi:predicted nucleic acid-binding protein
LREFVSCGTNGMTDGDFGRIYLDTNIFIMAFERRDEISVDLTQLFAAGDRGNEQRFVTSELTLAELLVKPYQERDDSLIDLYEGLILTNDWLEVLPIVPLTLRYTAVLRAQYTNLKLPDAIHLSTAIGTNCSHVLTDDHGIKGEYKLIHHRYGSAKQASPLTTVRPNVATLTSLIKSLNA